ncbi:hypothetical protein [Desulfobacula sp.]|uniref:hypothetical protein n=1 Tax=Desulfobacula sp. TaxID=2593537 RepID=UPI0025BE7623|nr:hypothetical protein [Desulfobacula sp.]MBC2705141.1 hypothetical protein [Desulfobacula sp.]
MIDNMLPHQHRLNNKHMILNWNVLNYLNYGDTLENFEILSHLNGSSVSKKLLINKLTDNGIKNPFLFEIIKSYCGRQMNKIESTDFIKSIQNSKEFKKYFSLMGCRGFSFKSYESIKIYCPPLKKDVNYSIALMPNGNLFYPPRIRRKLCRFSYNHYKKGGYSSICFSLCKIINKDCFVVVMQSDYVRKNSSYIKDHFRGWRKILLMVIAYKLRNICENIFIPSAEDIFKGCHPDFSKSDCTPTQWFQIYDRTAMDFGASEVHLQNPVNIQMYDGNKPVWVENCFKIKINNSI